MEGDDPSRKVMEEEKPGQRKGMEEETQVKEGYGRRYPMPKKGMEGKPRSKMLDEKQEKQSMLRKTLSYKKKKTKQ